MRRIWVSLAAVMALAGCASVPDPGAPAAPSAAQARAEEEDLFVLQIDVGRTGVFNDRIAEALALMPEGYPEREGMSILEVRQRDLRAITAALRRTALDYLELETDACAAGKFTAIACKGGPVPLWLSERPDAVIAPQTLRARLEELQARMDPLLAAACEAGDRLRKEEDVPPFCSVE